MEHTPESGGPPPSGPSVGPRADRDRHGREPGSSRDADKRQPQPSFESRWGSQSPERDCDVWGSTASVHQRPFTSHNGRLVQRVLGGVTSVSAKKVEQDLVKAFGPFEHHEMARDRQDGFLRSLNNARDSIGNLLTEWHVSLRGHRQSRYPYF